MTDDEAAAFISGPAHEYVMSPAECFAESQRHLVKADSIWDEIAPGNDGMARYNALVSTAAVYAELAKVQLSRADGAAIGLDISDDSEEDLRP